MRTAPIVIAFVCVTLVSACFAPVTRLEPSMDPWTSYELGREEFAATGSPMVEWFGHAGFLPGYVMVEPVEVDAIGRQPPSPSTARIWGVRYTYHGPCSGGDFVVTHSDFYREEIGIIISEDGSIPCEDSVLQVRGTKRGRDFATPGFVGKRVFAPAPGPFLADRRQAPIKWELIYGGRAGNEIRVTYREYAAGPLGTFARPAFYQELQYDLAASPRIVFRATEIDVIEASNAGIRFRVLQDGP